MKILQLLKAPFPDQSDPKDSFVNIGYIAVFVFLFLYLIRPFGLRTLENGHFKIALIYGLITFITGCLFDFISFYVLKIKRDTPSWTLGKWICMTILLILFIGIANFLCSVFYGWAEIHWFGLINMIYSTFLIGIFPVVITGLILQGRSSKKFEATADVLQKKVIQPVEIQQKQENNEPKLFEIDIRAIRYVQSMQNYISIVYISENGLNKEMRRMTLQQSEADAKDSRLIRCHRSYMVHLDHIKQIDGNAQGLKLTLDGCEDTVPVSRKFVPIIRTALD